MADDPARLLLGPLLRYVGPDFTGTNPAGTNPAGTNPAGTDTACATIWVETDRPCTVSVSTTVPDAQASAPTFAVGDHHYALVLIRGLPVATPTPYTVLLDEEPVWPTDGSFPASQGMQPYRVTNVPAGFSLMFTAGVLSGVLGIGSGAVKVLAMDRAIKLPFKVSTTTSNFIIHKGSFSIKDLIPSRCSS